MKLRTLLLGTTSLCLLGLLPMTASAQDAGLVAAYNAYVSASSGEDADAKAAAEAAFLAECQRVGVPSLDACIAVATGAAPAEPAPAEATPVEEPSAEPAAPVEEAAPEPEAQAEPAAEPAPAEPAPAEPAPAEDAAPPTEPEAPAAAPEATASEQPAAEPAPEQPAEDQPAAEEPAPADEPAADPAAAAAEQPAAPAEAASPADDPALRAAYENYVVAASGSDEAARASAEAAFLAECTRLGIASRDECLAVMGGMAVTPVAPTEQPAAPAEGEAAPAGDAPVEEVIPDVETPDAPVAPVLDSAKEDARRGAEPAPAEQPDALDATPTPPSSDAEAQVALPVPAEAVEAIVTEEGTRITELPIEQPQNVEVLRRTDDNRFVINVGINVTIYTPYKDRDRIGRGASEVYYDELRNGRVRQTVVRQDGSRVITVWNRFGEIEQRIKVRPDGSRIVLVYVERDRDDWRDPGRDLPPFRLPIPVTEYVLYSDSADEAQIARFLDQPPLERVERVYSIDEVKRSARIRDTVRRVDIGDITFATDSAEVERQEVGSLSAVAQAMAQLIEDDPSEVFLIEGHTDAVGDDEYNLDLSDRRAETIANLLTDLYGIPPENLTTQGYGEEYLKVLTEGPERANRRVTVRRITPLVSADNA